MLNTPHLNIPDNFNGLSLSEGLALICDKFPSGLVFSTSFSIEDQVILHHINKYNLPVSIFTLDTGRLFPETYSVWQRTNDQLTSKITAYYPNETNLQTYISENGPNAFYTSVDHRKACCNLRKVEPLKRALRDKSVWITGLRAEHSANRQNMSLLEWDESNKITKYNPLLNWTTEQVRKYIDDNEVPYNILHDRGFVSIGCAPCTRAIRAGEDFRAGRWWWEDADKKECGLHVGQHAQQ